MESLMCWKTKMPKEKHLQSNQCERACLQFRAIRSQCPGLLKSTVMPGTMPPVISQPERYRHCAKNGFNSNSCQRRDVAEPSSVHEQTRNVRISSSLWYIHAGHPSNGWIGFIYLSRLATTNWINAPLHPWVALRIQSRNCETPQKQKV